jgi:hypothetical protein
MMAEREATIQLDAQNNHLVSQVSFAKQRGPVSRHCFSPYQITALRQILSAPCAGGLPQEEVGLSLVPFSVREWRS